MSSAVSWKESLDEARNERQVLAIVREFAARLEPRDLAALPEQCRPGKFLEANDVSGFALDLMRTDFTHALPAAAVARELIAFFFHASQRLSYLAASVNDAERAERFSHPGDIGAA
jgi:hypothetical protein